MTGEWIKMRTDLARDPAVMELAEAQGVDELFVVGQLHKFWSWVDEQTVDGNAPSVTVSRVNRYMGTKDFAQMLENVGWLEITKEGFNIPKMERHMSQTAKGRSLTKKRVNKHRRKKQTKTGVTQQALHPSSSSSYSYSSLNNKKNSLDLDEIELKKIENQSLKSACQNWIRYRVENGNAYKPIGLKQFVTRVLKLSGQHGAAAVIEKLEAAMSNGWSGWEHGDWTTNGQLRTAEDRDRESLKRALAKRDAERATNDAR